MKSSISSIQVQLADPLMTSLNQRSNGRRRTEERSTVVEERQEDPVREREVNDRENRLDEWGEEIKGREDGGERQMGGDDMIIKCSGAADERWRRGAKEGKMDRERM